MKLVTTMKDVREGYTELQRKQLNEGLTMCRRKLMEGMKSSSSSHKDLIGGVKLCVVKEILQFLHQRNEDLGVSADELEFLKMDNRSEPFTDKYPIEDKEIDKETITESQEISATSTVKDVSTSVSKADIEISFKNADESMENQFRNVNYNCLVFTEMSSFK